MRALSSQANYVIVIGFRAPLDLDTYPYIFVHGAPNGLNAAEVSQCSLCILAFSLVFTPYLSNVVVLAKSPDYFDALVALKMLVSLISRLVACSPSRQTDRQTHRTTTVTLTAHARRGLTTLTRVKLLSSYNKLKIIKETLSNNACTSISTHKLHSRESIAVVQYIITVRML